MAAAQHTRDLSLYYAMDQAAFVDNRATQQALLTKEAEQARVGWDRARRSAQTAPDDETAAALEQDAARWLDRLRTARRSLEALEAEANSEEQADVAFESSTQLIDAALSRIATTDRVTQAEIDAFHELTDGWSMIPRADGALDASVTVRLPVKGGALLIPVRWEIAQLSVGTQAVRAQIDRPTGAPVVKREQTVHDLTEAGLSRLAALVVTNAPFTELPQLVREFVLGDPEAEWVGPQWREPAFVEHIRSVYLDPKFQWNGRGKYVLYSWMRQAAVDLALERGAISTQDLIDEHPAASKHTLQSFCGVGPPNGVIRRWAPVLDGTLERNKLRASARVCWCGAPGVAVARVPEVPKDLICEAGHPLQDAPPQGGVVVLPDAYRVLRMSGEQVRLALRQSRAARNRQLPVTTPTPGQPKVLEVLPWVGHEPVSAAQVGDALGAHQSAAGTQLKKMAAIGWVVRFDGWPARWARTANAPL
ncbi:hypothetical protein [Cellulomonas sp. NPDC058312]|uniref:hypothetical protein n=1 Tax=Cellulomonas sp. NPDC058312 TaxID=3346441 RepID=UPI0036E2D800